MEKMITTDKKKSSKGASLVEYALLVALIAIACIVILRVVGTKVSTQFSKIASAI